MLLHKYLPDCCDQCCDCEKADPKKDRVIINTPLSAQEKVLAKEDPLFGKEPSKPKNLAEEFVKPPKDIHDDVKEKELEEAARIIQELALIEKQAEEARRKQAEELELKKVQEVAEALEVQEAVEAQELLEAQEASLREHQMMLQKERDGDDAKVLDEVQLMRQQSRQEAQEDQLKVDSFLKANGFADLDSKRKKFFKSFYPLHSAVSQKNADMVQLLLAAGARPTLKNSAGLTALQLAQKLDRNGSHTQIVKLLQFGASN